MNRLNLAAHLICHHIYNSLIKSNIIWCTQKSLILIQQYFIQQATMAMKSLFTTPKSKPQSNPNPNPIILLLKLSIKVNQIIHSSKNLIHKKHIPDGKDPLMACDHCTSWLIRSSISLLFKILVDQVFNIPLAQYSNWEVYPFSCSFCSKVLSAPMVHHNRNYYQCGSLEFDWCGNPPESDWVCHSKLCCIHQKSVDYVLGNLLSNQILTFVVTFHQMSVKPFCSFFKVFKNESSNWIVVTFFHWHKEELNWFHYALSVVVVIRIHKWQPFYRWSLFATVS